MTGKRSVQLRPLSAAERTRVGLLCALVAIFVARPLLPSETPTTIAGDGLPFVMLTLMLAACWVLSQLAWPPGTVRCGLAEAAWLALLGWLGVSVIAVARGGFARAAINGFWEWCGLGLGYLLLRQLLRSDAEKRAVLLVMVGLAVILSLDGLYQFSIEIPEARKRYQRDPESVLREAEVKAPPGSTARVLFAQRLASTEPSATFALANSLAGFLTPWVLVALTLGWIAHDGDAARLWRRLRTTIAALGALTIAACLVLTKSRAGYLATLVGFAALVFLSRRTWRQTWLMLWASGMAAAALAATGLAVGALDREVIGEAFKSLSYRWHYWQGALAIAKEHPWFGCGPGNFQDSYTQFKLPEASEVVADPHNFLFEIWSTSGTPGLLAFLGILVGLAREVWRTGITSPAESHKPPAAALSPADDRAAMIVAVAGVILGFAMAFAFGLFSTVRLPRTLAVCCIPLIAFLGCFAGWLRTGTLPRYVPLVAAAALLINLLVAGGIGFAGVAGSLWLLLAIGITDERRAVLPVPRHWLVGLFLTTAGLFLSCYLTAYRPVLECRRLVEQAIRESDDARRTLLEATEADPRSDEPWRLLAEGDFELWRRNPQLDPSKWEAEQAEVLRRRPRSSAAWQEAGERYRTAVRESSGDRGQAFLMAAIDHLRKAAELYPNSALVHAHLALALAAAHHPQATEEAARALALHRQTPHLDQKLPEDVLPSIQALAE
ncbi:MAG TPA: O-antigen ligase family protein [Pirellulales bacterium]|nr:O-antigen ligase family protein [Pirellulales bacterium]